MRRSGFTLIELLVVLTIITILLSISWAVYGTTVQTAREAATRTTITELQIGVDARASAIGRFNIKPLAQKFRESYRQGGNANPNQTITPEVAEIMVRKNIYKQALPSRLEDLWGFDQVAGTADDSPLWKVWKDTVNAVVPPLGATDATPRPANHRRDLENIELLVLSLTKGSAFGETRFNIDRLTARHKQDKNKNGIIEIVDDWGNPIRFYNWTHRLVRPGGGTTDITQAYFGQTAHLLLTAVSPPATPSPFPATEFSHTLNQDQDDYTGALAAQITATNVFQNPFQIDLDVGAGTNIVTCPAFDEATYHPLDTYGPNLIISAGGDGKLGLYEPTEASNPERRLAEPLSYSDSTQDLDVIFDNVTTRR